jgi:hypothetical protein
MLVELDDANDRLNKTLGILRNSIVDPAFSIPNPGSEDRALVEKARTLHDFVDDEGIENVKSRLRHLIDQVQVLAHPLSSLVRPKPPFCGLVCCAVNYLLIPNSLSRSRTIRS